MKDIAKQLQQKGYRFTKQRQVIFDALTAHPQSVEEIVVSLKEKGVSIDRVTVYRTLDRFVDLSIVSKTQFKDKTAKYELFSKTNHHHHLVCESCGSIEDISLNEAFFLNKVSSQTNFQIKSHALEFFGICGKCQT